MKDDSYNPIKLFDLTNDEAKIFTKRFRHKVVTKNTVLLRAGETALEVYYVLSGCMRLFYEKEGADISAYFFMEGMFGGAYDSFISQKPSRHSIQTNEDCQVLSISVKDFKQLLIELPKANEIVRKILEERFISLHQLYTSLILDTPEERYLNLLRDQPNLLNRVPQHQIATFLGVTPVSLSRIRNRVSRR